MAKTVLIVEDEPFLRDIMHMSLKEYDISIDTAANGEEAIESIDRHAPDLMLLDLLMPKMDGYAVLRHLHDNQLAFPVVVLSNLSDPDEQEKCKQMGVRDFVVKSNLNEDELWEHVEPYIS